MLIPNETLLEVMEILRQMGVAWTEPIDNPMQPRYKGFFRGNLIAIYCDDSPISEIKCLNPAYAADFEDLLKSFFTQESGPDSQITES